MRDQGSNGWGQGSEGLDPGSRPRDQGTQTMGSGSAVFSGSWIRLFPFWNQRSEICVQKWDQRWKNILRYHPVFKHDSPAEFQR